MTAPDTDTFTSLYAKYQPTLVNYARNFTASTAAAEDLVQEAMLRAWAHREDISSGALGGWLFRVIRNMATDQHRRQAVREKAAPLLLLDSRPAPDISGPVADAVTVRAALDKLPRAEKAAVSARYLQQLSVAESAEALGIPRGTVHSRTSRALAALRPAVQANDTMNESPRPRRAARR